MQLTVLGSGTVAPSASRTAPAHWLSTGDVRLLLDCGSGALHRAASFGLPWYDLTHVALTHYHADHWTDLPLLLFAMRWGHEPMRVEPLQVIGPAGLGERLEALSKAFGQWVLEPGYPLHLKEIRPGESVRLDNGIQLESHPTPHTEESVAYAVRSGDQRMVYTGDTGPSEKLAAWAVGCDLLLCECSLPENRAIDIHLTPTQAGQLAAEARAGSLVLTHFYPPVESPDPATIAGAVFNGEVVAASDGDQFVIGTEPECS